MTDDTEINDRFQVQSISDGRYMVIDTSNGQFVRFSYQRPLYGSENKPADKWGNYYAARGFAQKLSHQCKAEARS